MVSSHQGRPPGRIKRQLLGDLFLLPLFRRAPDKSSHSQVRFGTHSSSARLHSLPCASAVLAQLLITWSDCDAGGASQACCALAGSPSGKLKADIREFWSILSHGNIYIYMQWISILSRNLDFNDERKTAIFFYNTRRISHLFQHW